MYAFSFYSILILSFIINVTNMQAWKHSLLLRTSIAFCPCCILAFLSIMLGEDYSETAQKMMIFLLAALHILFLIACFLHPRHIWLSVLIFSIPYITVCFISWYYDGWFIAS